MNVPVVSSQETPATETLWTWHAAPKVSLTVLVLLVTALGAFVFRDREATDAASTLENGPSTGNAGAVPPVALVEELPEPNSPRLARRDAGKTASESSQAFPNNSTPELSESDGTASRPLAEPQGEPTLATPSLEEPTLAPLPGDSQSPAASPSDQTLNSIHAGQAPLSSAVGASQAAQLPHIENGSPVNQYGVIFPARAASSKEAPDVRLAEQLSNSGAKHVRR